jgi:hypothetical protein
MCLECGLKQWPEGHPAYLKPGRVFWKVFHQASDGKLYPCYRGGSRRFLKGGRWNEAADFSRFPEETLGFLFPSDGRNVRGGYYPQGFHCYVDREDADYLAYDLRRQMNRRYVVYRVAVEGVLTYGVQAPRCRVVVADRMKLFKEEV